MNKTIWIMVAILNTKTFAISFNEGLKKLHKHESIEAIISKSNATKEDALISGSWGDPKFMIAARNFPKDSLDKDKTPMTGIEFGISQKVALTTKYGNIEDAINSMSRALSYEVEDRKEALTRGLWDILITKRRLTSELEILKENKAWIVKILTVSKKLYANGKVSQQALLDIQIRNSEIESEISNKQFELDQLGDMLKYLIGESSVDDSTIPWMVLVNRRAPRNVDNRELSFKEKVTAKEFALTASRQNYIPDITVSLGYTKRSNIDNKGDFVGASIVFPLALSGESYAKHSKAVEEKYMEKRNYENYKILKTRDVAILQKEIDKIINELTILNSKTIVFATNSREITSKSYGLGSASYSELLQSELKLQKLLMQKIMLEAKRDSKKIELRYLMGDFLNG